MTPKSLSTLHARCFAGPAAWDEKTFAGFLSTPGISLFAIQDGFILTRLAADEAEILTLAVHPDARGKGVGSALLSQAIGAAGAKGAAQIFLEVAADNQAAIALYAGSNFAQDGIRPRYYRRPGAEPVDAILMSRPTDLSTGQKRS